jgi:hypothetical protein
MRSEKRRKRGKRERGGISDHDDDDAFVVNDADNHVTIMVGMRQRSGQRIIVCERHRN